MPRATTRAPGPLSENLSLEFFSFLPHFTLTTFSLLPPSHRPFTPAARFHPFSLSLFRLPLTPFVSFNGGTRVIAVPLNFKKKAPMGASLSRATPGVLLSGLEEKRAGERVAYALIIKQVRSSK